MITFPSGIIAPTPAAITAPTPAAVNKEPKAAKTCGRIPVVPTLSVKRIPSLNGKENLGLKIK